MQATGFEYRFRFWIHALIYALGFLAVPVVTRFLPGAADALALSDKSSWLVLSAILSRQGWLPFQTATLVLLLIAILFTGLAAWLRVWGTAYVGSTIVKSTTMHGDAMLADGPYRHTRNPLYLGTLLHTIGLAILMPPAGAIFAIVLLWVFQFRLALAEETFLATRFGQPYITYKTAVPRFLPVPAAQVPSAGLSPHWLQAILGEIYFVGAFITLTIFGWNFNATPLYRGILISLGAAFIAQAFLPKPTAIDTTETA
jgi:protein-S-isoprenylcysteine O-methyltransferase Ste14